MLLVLGDFNARLGFFINVILERTVIWLFNDGKIAILSGPTRERISAVQQLTLQVARLQVRATTLGKSPLWYFQIDHLREWFIFISEREGGSVRLTVIKGPVSVVETLKLESW